MLENLPEEVRGFLIGVAGLVPTALTARMLYHRKLVKAGHRRFWSRDLLWEGPTAVLCAIIGGGLAQWLGAEGMASNGIVGFVAWLGPRGLEELVFRFASRPGGPPAA